MDTQRRAASFYLILALKGFCMGAADVVPGVSGGTMAFILGIYEELIGGIRAVDFRFFRRLVSFRLREAWAGVPWKFLLAVALGIFTAIFTLARIIKWLLENQPVLISAFFFGLILASIVTVAKRVNKWTPKLYFSAMAGAIGAYFLVGLVPMETPQAPWFLFLAGAVAICAMILPGISGAFILLLLGKYHYLITAIDNRDILTILIAGMGMAVGLLSFSRLLGWLIDRHREVTIAVLTGLMIGSLRKIWPFKIMGNNVLPSTFSNEVWLAILLALAGAILVLALEHLAGRSNR